MVFPSSFFLGVALNLKKGYQFYARSYEYITIDARTSRVFLVSCHKIFSAKQYFKTVNMV